jgi:hypothetical protein
VHAVQVDGHGEDLHGHVGQGRRLSLGAGEAQAGIIEQQAGPGSHCRACELRRFVQRPSMRLMAVAE